MGIGRLRQSKNLHLVVRKIAVTQRLVNEPRTGETRDCLDHRLNLMVTNLGFLPVPIPNVLGEDANEVERWIDAISPSGIILSGGGNVGSQSESLRDELERSLIDRAVRDGLPLLGICRGMQQIGIVFGVALQPVKNHVSCQHTLVGDYSHRVNSYHEYALAECPSNFRVAAKTSDGVIEAITHKSLPILGVMWHPERVNLMSREDYDAINRLFGP